MDWTTLWAYLSGSVDEDRITDRDAEHSVCLVQTIDAKRQCLLGLLPEI